MTLRAGAAAAAMAALVAVACGTATATAPSRSGGTGAAGVEGSGPAAPSSTVPAWLTPLGSDSTTAAADGGAATTGTTSSSPGVTLPGETVESTAPERTGGSDPSATTVATRPERSAPTTSTASVPRPPGTLSATSTTTPPATPASVVVTHAAGVGDLPVRVVVPPVAIRVEGVAIDAGVIPVSAYPDSGELAVPPSADLVAWYEHGPAPGEAGSTVLTAHVDFNGRRGAFFDLDLVTAGTRLTVTLADGTERSYVVTGGEQVAKVDLPRDRVFARVGPSRLVLLTCGGAFDRSRGHYFDNVIVYADPV